MNGTLAILKAKYCPEDKEDKREILFSSDSSSSCGFTVNKAALSNAMQEHSSLQQEQEELLLISAMQELLKSMSTNNSPSHKTSERKERMLKSLNELFKGSRLS